MPFFYIFCKKKQKKQKTRNSVDLLSSRSTAETKTANHRRASYRKYFLVDIDITTKKTIMKKKMFLSVLLLMVGPKGKFVDVFGWFVGELVWLSLLRFRSSVERD